MNDSASVKEHQSRFWTFSLTVYGDAAVQREALISRIVTALTSTCSCFAPLSAPFTALYCLITT